MGKWHSEDGLAHPQGARDVTNGAVVAVLPSNRIPVLI